jgi:osmoprotectant transport system permease protein
MIAAWDYFRDHQSDILGWLWTTVWLAAIPLVAGLIIALPIGWMCSRYSWTYPPITAGIGILYTIPSLVLFLALPGIIGTHILDAINVAVALTLYTIALLVRVVADGLSSVSKDTLASASAMGYTNRQRLFSVQLPIAIPVIGAGLRVAAVSNVSLISVASVIGVTQLGQLFVVGYTLSLVPPTIVGLVLFILLALVFDLLILLGIRTLTPWQRAAARR